MNEKRNETFPRFYNLPYFFCGFFKGILMHLRKMKNSLFKRVVKCKEILA